MITQLHLILMEKQEEMALDCRQIQVIMIIGNFHVLTELLMF